LIDIIILAIVQGIAEFLPISSSGHLVIVQNLLGISDPRLLLVVLLHLATLLAVIIFLRSFLFSVFKDCAIFIRQTRSSIQPHLKVALMAVLGCFPAFIAVFFFKDYFMSFFSSPQKTAFLLMVNGFILMIYRFIRPNSNITIHTFKIHHALLIGGAQSLAILPGISRSGMTITSALLLGVEPILAFQFSFLLAIPAILGAVVLEGAEVLTMESTNLFKYSIGFIIAFITGYVSLIYLKRFVIDKKLYKFSLYCIATGLLFTCYFVLVR